MAHFWPGNLHELRNEITRATLLCPQSVLTNAHLTGRIEVTVAPEPWIGGPFTLRTVGDAHVRRIVSQTSTLEQAALHLGIQPSTLWYRRRHRARTSQSPSVRA